MGERSHTMYTFARTRVTQDVDVASDSPMETLGDFCTTPDGRLWQYVRLDLDDSAEEDLDYGMIVSNPQLYGWGEAGAARWDVDGNLNEILAPTPAGWTITPTDALVIARFAIITAAATEVELIGQGGIVLDWDANRIRLDRNLAHDTDENNLQFAVYELSLQDVEPCNCSGQGHESCVVVGASACITPVTDGQYFWMNVGPRGSLAHILALADVSAGDCLKCSASEGIADTVVAGDCTDGSIGNKTFAEAVTDAVAADGLASSLILAKWL